MPVNFTFILSQQQTFELRCNYGSRRLNKAELGALINLCEQTLVRETLRQPTLSHPVGTAIIIV
ncbi:hypothetical protein [Nostoc sp. 'Lobaria pulmonaria (5183) cyanobiont']|uniref:hypothetical protein n=1 Tax=Nostoc sp. 'Lobaria pulmonaria (5183) cyanobiont' TaxID=1618022 RepID=UPI000CF32106|nr:hypothetical protein [Nostoc sp. 'Lobaria pulmonaria (5183) cyanobiont']